MHILVDGTTVTAWGEEPPEAAGIPFEVDDFPGVEEGRILHWDGIRWWTEPDVLDAADVLAALFAADPGTLDALPDEALAKMAPYLPEWGSGRPYAVNDKVAHSDRTWRCLLAHTSQDTWTPEAAPSLWARIGNPADEWPEWVQPTGAHDAYAAGDKVSHAGKRWTSDIDANAYEPGVYGWTEAA